MKGIFILLIFFTHFSQYVTYTDPLDVLHINVLRYLGQAVVAMFLFYSGYGVTKALTYRGDEYANLIPVHRILATLIRFDCAVILFLIVNFYIGNDVTIKEFLLSLLTWHSVGNSNWYIFAIICAYAFSFVAYKTVGMDRKKHLLLVFGFECFYVFILYYFKLQGGWWYDTAWCYPLGVLWSLYCDEINQFVDKHDKYYLLILVGLVALYIVFGKSGKFVLFRNLDFTLFFVLLTMRVRIFNPILYWCGNNLFELYILQRIPMILLKHYHVEQYSIVLYFCLVVALTIIMVKPFQYIEFSVLRKVGIDGK